MRETKLYTLSGRPIHRSYIRVRDKYCLRSFNFFKGENMFNRNLSVVCVGLGVFANLFVALANKSLANETAETFGLLGSFAIGTGVLVYMLSRKSEAEEREERADLHRDIDAVYRHIDDTRRDLSEEIRDCERNCAMNRGTCSHTPTDVRGKR